MDASKGNAAPKVGLDRSKTGRKKGTPNKTTALLKDAIIKAAESVGEDGEGREGLVGYLKRVAKEDVKAFSSLLGKVLPLQVTGDNDGPLQIIVYPEDRSV
ncbi:hypothetical protein [Xanthobacter autotrophicus]|uniref:hypothetical protein n=1 Tax=Xanthobacter autotrophicus TaxID=280 RepID=UPI0037282D45